ncbi:MAG: PAS domain S-box protein [Methylophilaceae bacterium]|jgi:PAS domain S-box-containing protein
MSNQNQNKRDFTSANLHFQAIFDNAFQFMGIIDLAGQLVEVNRTALEFVGAAHEDVVGLPAWETPWWRGAGGEQSARLQDAIARAATGVPVRYEATHVGVDGHAAVFDFSLRPLTDGNGGFAYLIAEGHDITGRVLSERKLRESEERFRLISDNVDDLIAVLDAQGRRLYNSPSYRRILGDSAEIGGDSFQRIHPDDRDRIRDLFQQVMQTGRGQLAEYRYILPDGSIKIVESQSSAVTNDEGQVVNVLIVARDISGRRQAEAEIHALNEALERRIVERTAELEAASERMRLLIDTANDAVITIEADSVVIDWNDMAETMFGWTREEALGRKVHHLIVPPAFRAMHEAGITRFLATGDHNILNQRVELKALHRDGHELDIELSVWPVKTGDTYTFSSFARDITLRKSYETELRQRSEQIRLHRDVLLDLVQAEKHDLDAALELILATSARTLQAEMVSYWDLNPEKTAITCRKMFRLSRNDVDPDSPGIVLYACNVPQYFASILEKHPLAADDALTHPGTREFSEFHLIPNNITSMLDIAVWHQGDVAGIICHEHVGKPHKWSPEEIDFAAAIGTTASLALEASSRYQAETEREAILQNSVVGIALFKDRVLVWANRNMETLFGYTKDEWSGHTSEIYYASPEEFERVGSEAYPLLAQGRTYHTECQMRRRDGTLFWSAISGSALDATDPGKGSIWTLMDITERIRSEHEMRRALEKEKELSELKSRFVAMTSHEFRTPLATILSSTELLEHYHDRLPQEEKVELMHSIKDSVERMTRMLDDVLLIGKSEAGKLEFNPGLMDLNAFCESLAGEFMLNRPAGIDLQARVGLCGTVCMDQKLLRHILGNLISNAIKYSPQGGKVEFEAHCDPGQVRFRVSDQGIGIPVEDIPGLFETFRRARNVGNISGTGLGLAIVKKSVELHGGQIEVDSAVGRGTTFTISIPLDQAGVRHG